MPSASSPFDLIVYSKAFARLGFIGNPQSLKVSLAHNAQGSATLVLDADHVRAGDLATPGARLVILYGGQQLMSGPVTLTAGQGPASTSTLTFTVTDDWCVLADTLGWQNPTQAIGSQGLDDTAYYTDSGPAESVLKRAVAANVVTRLGRPVTVAPDQARGAPVSVSMRMDRLVDKLFPAVDTAGIGVTVRQASTGAHGGGLVVDCYVPHVYPQTLSEASGVVADWSYSSASPTVTRVVVAAQGQAAARVFIEVSDAALEATWGRVIEVARDARDTDDDATLLQRGQDTLADGAPKYGLSITLAESVGFRYGRTAGGGGVQVGDQVSLRVGADVVITDVLRTATLAWDRQNGLVITPTVGDRSDDPSTVLGRALAGMAKSIRSLITRE